MIKLYTGDYYDYTNHTKHDKITKFLNDIFHPVELNSNEIYYNDDRSLANVGMSATFTISIETTKQLLQSYQPNMIPKLHEMCENIKKNMYDAISKQTDEINEENPQVIEKYKVEDNPIINHLIQHYNSDPCFFYVATSDEHPMFSRKSVVFYTPHLEFISEKDWEFYNQLCSIMSELCYELFKFWFNEEVKEQKYIVEMQLKERIENLEKKFLRNSAYEQAIVIERLKEFLHKEK